MLELVIKHIALGLLGYWRQGFNVLDGIIVAASIAELGVTRKGYVTCRSANLILSCRVQPHQPGCNLRVPSHELGWRHHC